MGIVDIRSIGYYKIKHYTLQQELSKHYQFEDVVQLCNAYNKMKSDQYDKSRLKTETDSKAKDPYPWLAPDAIRRNMSDREILEKYINLDDSCLNKTGKRK